MTRSLAGRLSIGVAMSSAGRTHRTRVRRRHVDSRCRCCSRVQPPDRKHPDTATDHLLYNLQENMLVWAIDAADARGNLLHVINLRHVISVPKP